MKTAIQLSVLRDLKRLEYKLSEIGRQVPQVEKLLRDAIAEARHEFEVYSVRDAIDNCEYYFLRRIEYSANEQAVNVLKRHPELMDHWDPEKFSVYLREVKG